MASTIRLERSEVSVNLACSILIGNFEMLDTWRAAPGQCTLARFAGRNPVGRLQEVLSVPHAEHQFCFGRNLQGGLCVIAVVLGYETKGYLL
jgi:hypothetical protein